MVSSLCGWIAVLRMCLFHFVYPFLCPYVPALFLSLSSCDSSCKCFLTGCRLSLLHQRWAHTKLLPSSGSPGNTFPLSCSWPCSSYEMFSFFSGSDSFPLDSVPTSSNERASTLRFSEVSSHFLNLLKLVALTTKNCNFEGIESSA